MLNNLPIARPETPASRSRFALNTFWIKFRLPLKKIKMRCCPMDKKAKKRIELLNKRLQKLRQQIAGVRQQLDEPEELARLEAEIGAAEAEIAQLKAS